MTEKHYPLTTCLVHNKTSVFQHPRSQTLKLAPLQGPTVCSVGLPLPRSPLPLHIFEARYRAMTRDALDGGGHIAMVQPSAAGDDPMNPPVYPVAFADT